MTVFNIFRRNNVPETNVDFYTQVSSFKLYQYSQYLLIFLPVVMNAMMNVNYIFVAEEVDYRCKVPECESLNSTVDIPDWWPEDTDPKCLKPVINYKNYYRDNQTCSNTTFFEQLEECHEWIYESNNSIVAELNLGCQSWKSTLVGSAHSAGMIFSMLVMGNLADRFGRKPTIIFGAVGGVIGVAKIFVTNYYIYILVEFLESLIASGVYTVAIVLMIEVGGDSQRVLAGVVYSYAFYVGEAVFAFLAMGFQYWKTIIIAIYSPLLLFLSYILILKESTRWQMLRGKMDEAKDTFKLIARMNNLNITEGEISAISSEELKSKFNVQVRKEKERVKDILNSKETMTRLMVTCFGFFTASFVYYGFAVNSVYLPGNKYINFGLTSISSFPGDLLAYFAFNRFGRRVSLQCGFVFCALCLIVQVFSPETMSWLKITLFLAGKMSVALCFTGMFTYSLELFPTSVRGSLVGVGNTAARIGNMLSPLTPLLTTQWKELPSILFACVAVIAALLLSFTPETKNLPMFDTIAQVESHKSKISTSL